METNIYIYEITDEFSVYTFSNKILQGTGNIEINREKTEKNIHNNFLY